MVRKRRSQKISRKKYRKRQSRKRQPKRRSKKYKSRKKPKNKYRMLGSEIQCESSSLSKVDEDLKKFCNILDKDGCEKNILKCLWCSDIEGDLDEEFNVIWKCKSKRGIAKRILRDRYDIKGIVQWLRKDGYTHLLEAIRNDNFDKARFLLVAGVNPNQEDAEGFIPLFWAILKYIRDENLDMIKLLYEYGATVDNDSKKRTRRLADSVESFELSNLIGSPPRITIQDLS